MSFSFFCNLRVYIQGLIGSRIGFRSYCIISVEIYIYSIITLRVRHLNDIPVPALHLHGQGLFGGEGLQALKLPVGALLGHLHKARVREGHLGSVSGTLADVKHVKELGEEHAAPAGHTVLITVKGVVHGVGEGVDREALRLELHDLLCRGAANGAGGDLQRLGHDIFNRNRHCVLGVGDLGAHLLFQGQVVHLQLLALLDAQGLAELLLLEGEGDLDGALLRLELHQVLVGVI